MKKAEGGCRLMQIHALSRVHTKNKYESWKKFAGNLLSMHLLATVRDGSCARKRSDRREGARGDNERRRKRADKRGSENAMRSGKCTKYNAREKKR